MIPKRFTYQFDAGPLKTEEELEGDWKVGNCRRLVQWYFFAARKTFLEPDRVLCPNAYFHTGNFIFSHSEKFDFERLPEGAIIYAARIRKSNERVRAFNPTDQSVIALHTAIFLRGKRKEILHATSITGTSCVWTAATFANHYQPITAKIIPE